MSQPAATRLDALTSLRFFAAMMIVLLHTQGRFGLGTTSFALGQGVSFFYVLSGFILTLVYPRLEGWAPIRKFWRARFARVWPGYVLALGVAAVLVGYPWRVDTAAAYLAMVHSWIPIPAYFFAYNEVGWSVATEWFFYLAFPLLVLDFERTWKWKLALSFAFVLAAAWLCTVVPMSANQFVWDPTEQYVLNQNGVMYIHPLARIFEFVVGMVVALAWRRRAGVAPMSAGMATALEVAVIALCIASMYFASWGRDWLEAWFGFPIARWFYASGSVFVFAALVFVAARGAGAVSRALAWRPLVVGGEISYSMYLLHSPLALAYDSRAQEFPPMPGIVAFALYLGVVWLVSFVAWRFVELPARRLIVGGELHGSSVLTQAPTRVARVAARLRPALALVVLLAVGLALNAAIAGPSRMTRSPDTEVPARRHAPRSCNIEIAGFMSMARGHPHPVYTSTIRLRGWFLSEISGQPGLPAQLRLLPVDGGAAWQGPIEHWIPRPDVLDKMQATGTGDAGFVQRFDLSALAPGTYKLQLLFEDEGRPYDCNTGQQLIVGAR